MDKEGFADWLKTNQAAGDEKIARKLMEEIEYRADYENHMDKDDADETVIYKVSLDMSHLLLAQTILAGHS